MAVNFNSIGNYSSFGVKGSTGSININSSGANAGTDKLSNDEKKYFADMYPSSKNEIMDYSFYGRSGKMSGISIGINLDRRG